MQDILWEMKKTVEEKSPLIHCLTNHITINDCANVILAAGGKPIMAEHPQEVEEITEHSQALCVNLGNITDERMESMLLSGEVARKQGIPILMDLVGVGCSKLRLAFAKEFIEKVRPNVMKGNMSEMKALVGTSHAVGIDVGVQDAVTEDNVYEAARIIQELAIYYDCVVAATGAIDIIASPQRVYIIRSGCEMMAKVTGTGCMLDGIIATYLTGENDLQATLLGTMLFNAVGEMQANVKGTASFKIALIDGVSIINQEDWKACYQVERVEV